MISLSPRLRDMTGIVLVGRDKTDLERVWTRQAGKNETEYPFVGRGKTDIVRNETRLIWAWTHRI